MKRIEGYGPGTAGNSARLIIEKYQEPCKECGGKADKTLDFDVNADLIQFAVCNNCVDIMIEKITQQLEATGRKYVGDTFGFNGFGRS